MKPLLPALFLSVITLVSVTGCASDNPNANAPVNSGKTGTMTVVNGIDIWQDEQPDRPYTVLRTIQDRRSAISPLNTIFQALARQARDAGGAGVIITSMKNDTTGGQLFNQTPYVPYTQTNVTDSSNTVTSAQVIIYKKTGLGPDVIRTNPPTVNTPPPAPTTMAPNGSL